MTRSRLHVEVPGQALFVSNVLRIANVFKERIVKAREISEILSVKSHERLVWMLKPTLKYTCPILVHPIL